ncbi:MAG: prepilin-type N-terminal cleavage/methylation domain-containing protein [Burkholderiaceae bacterium]|nr:prepilin-type N-terminal cleavage/methylation domain-containing protein [Burkholderiaceae bacterium]
MRSNTCQYIDLRRGAQHGFTLLEVIVVMAVVAILAAVAIPNYSEYVMRSHRADAQSFISDVASRQSQFFLDRRSYSTTVAALNVTPSAAVAARYTIGIAVVAGPPAGFQVTATPTGAQASDRCGLLTVDQANNRTAIGTRCW